MKYRIQGATVAREGVTYEMVAAVADKMVGDGGNVTIMGVRDALGTGSPNTIHQHLKVWKSMRPQAAAAAYELPAELVNAFGRELAKAAAAARAEVEEQLVEAQLAADHLSNVGETLEAERDDALEALAGMTTERDAATATAAAHAAEIQRLLEAVDRERKSAEEARLELAKAELTAEAKDRWIEEQAAEIKALKAELAEAQGARQAAAVELRGTQAELVASQAARAELAQDRDGLKESLKAARADLKAQAEALGASQAEAKRLAAQVAAQAADIKAQAEALARADALAKAQGEELLTERQAHRDGVAQLRAELSATEKGLATAGAKAEAAAEAKAAVQGDLVAARQRIEALEQAVAVERKTHKDELAQIRAEMAAERQAHKAEVVALRAELAEARKPLPAAPAKAE